MEKCKSKGWTKDEQREVLRMLAERRQAPTPEHKDPDWMAAFRDRALT